MIMGCFVLGYLFLVNPPVDRNDNVYETKRFDHSEFSNVKFREVALDMGIESESKFREIWPSVSVVDVNNDGFMDIYVTAGNDNGLIKIPNPEVYKLKRPNLLFINNQGKSFTEEADKYGIGDLNRDSPSSQALWADFNKDGLLDLLVAKRGCHRFYHGKKGGGFVERTELLNGYCSRPDGVNVADFYNSGRLDIVFGNYVSPVGENDFDSTLWMQSIRMENTTGGKNELLINSGAAGFSIDSRADFLSRSYTHSVGISDINEDGKPDIFFANDFGFDEMFINKGSGKFTDVTNYYIPKELHGHSGMNAEFFDSQNRGKIDLYVTNIYKPPFYRAFNLLWKKMPDNRFSNISQQVGTGQCGFSWAAKFADFNNDGEPDLFVVNGRDRGPAVMGYDEGKSMWFERTEVAQIPRFIKKLYKGDSFDNRFVSAFERKCLFMKKGEAYHDIAVDAGLGDRNENRGMALIDYDNDGKMDIVTSGPSTRVKLFHNESSLPADESHWLGLALIDKNGNRIPHGAKIYLVMKNKTKVLREFYPANGYKGFTDSRLHFGLGKSADISHVEVRWPLSGTTKRYTQLKLDQYNTINE